MEEYILILTKIKEDIEYYIGDWYDGPGEPTYYRNKIEEIIEILKK